MSKNYEAHGHACIVCGMIGEGLVAWHHLMTRKAHPELAEEPRNKIPVCQQDHNNFHTKGAFSMAAKHPRVSAWLINRGWQKDLTREKWLLGK
jgi:ABC-type proline/glycine betaine transport system substrate-binding protein